MARLSSTDRTQRVLLLLLGLRYREVLKPLVVHGFDEAELARGWALLSRLTDGVFTNLPEAEDPPLLAMLDQWENRWYPIADLALRLYFPEAHEHVFRNLRQGDGKEVLVTVQVLLTRLDRLPLPKTRGGLGKLGREARAHLAKRGLNAATMDEARGILAQLQTLPEGRPTVPFLSNEEAERELWRWYLEWSAIARANIKERRLLRALGFLRGAKKDSEEEP